MKSFTIYGRPGCGYCVRAVQLCEALNFDYQYIDMWAENISKQDLEQRTGKPVYTVPQIFHDDRHIGGYDDLSLYVKTLREPAY